MKWIAVDQAKPEVGEVVLLRVKGPAPELEVGYLGKNDYWRCYISDDSLPLGAVSHWQPKPALDLDREAAGQEAVDRRLDRLNQAINYYRQERQRAEDRILSCHGMIGELERANAFLKEKAADLMQAVKPFAHVAMDLTGFSDPDQEDWNRAVSVYQRYDNGRE